MIKPTDELDDVEVSTEVRKTKLKKVHPPMKDWILNRLGEKTTWRGIFTVLTIGGVSVAPELKTAIITSGISLVGLLDVIFKEPQSKDAKK